MYNEIKEQANETYRNKIIEVIKKLNDTRNLMSIYYFAEAKIKFEQNK